MTEPAPAQTPFDVDAYINTLNRKENKDAARGALNAMADSGTRGLESYAQGEQAIGAARNAALANPTGGSGTFSDVPDALRDQLQSTVAAPLDRSLGSLASSRSTFQQDLERQRAMSTNYFSQLDASPLFPVLTGGGGGGGGGGWGGGGGGGSRPYSKTESRNISVEAARETARAAVTGLARNAVSIARGQSRVRKATRRPTTARRVVQQQQNDSEAYRKLQQVLGSRVPTTRKPTVKKPGPQRRVDPRLARELADAQRQAPRGRYVTPTSRRYTTVKPQPAPAPRATTRVTYQTRPMPPTGQARAQRAQLMNPDPGVTARIQAQADSIYDRMQQTVRTPEYRDMAARGFFSPDPERRALAAQESNESNRFSSVLDDAYMNVAKEAFKFGAAPGELQYAETIFDTPMGAGGIPLAETNPALARRLTDVAGTRVGVMPTIDQLPPELLRILRAGEAGVPEQLRIGREVMASLGWDPALLTEDDVLTYMNKMGTNMRDQEKLIEEADYMARTGGAFRSPKAQIDAMEVPGQLMDAQRAADSYLELGFDSPDAAMEWAEDERRQAALQQGTYTYAGEPFETRGEMQTAANRDVEFNEEQDELAATNYVNQSGAYNIDPGQLREFADRSDSSVRTVASIMSDPIYVNVYRSAVNKWEAEGRNGDRFARWSDEDPEEMFPEDPDMARTAQALDGDPLYKPVWRALLRTQVLSGGD